MTIRYEDVGAFPTLEIDDMRLALGPTIGDNGEVLDGEWGTIWSADEGLPWNSDVSTRYDNTGFSLRVHTPYHETRTIHTEGNNSQPAPMFALGCRPLRVTVERPGGFLAEERHMIIAGLVRTQFKLASSRYPD